ncbi:threonine ammonia-lyase [Rhizohabitans arisaemae]|uniref:threonine ammonia-lyase n=1 Tax=Rhizohabitans arisaemae TaxID=2720610 RepID=UPI0024B155F1|nr:threonine/serine dehydratase [Rhizohabitans arisaemae]
MRLITMEDVRTASEAIRGTAVRTPLLPVPTLSGASGGFWVKPENLQPIGAFKIRGAHNALVALGPSRAARGVVTHSSGNHGQALAYAARVLGVPCVVVSPENAAPVKVAAMRDLGAEVVLVGLDERLDTAEEIAADRGMALIPPFDHPDVIAGQGTVGLEILEDLPDVDVVLVPVGGGGLAAGVSTAVKALRPRTVVLGVEPGLAADAQESLVAGELMAWPAARTSRTVADGLRSTSLSELTFAHLKEHLDGIVTVSEEEIKSAMRELVRAARLVAEPSGAVTTAAYLAGRTPPGRTVAVVSGGNTDPAFLATLL